MKNERQVLRPTLRPQIILSLIFGGVVAAAAAKGFIAQRTDLLHGAVINACLWAACVAWLRSFRLETDADSLLYKAPLARRIRIPLTEIRIIHLRRIAVGSKWQSVGYQTMAVEVKARPAPFILNARIFPEKELKLFLENLASRGIPVKN